MNALSGFRLKGEYLMSMQEGAKNIRDLVEKIKPHLADMRGTHTNRVYEIIISYDKETDEFNITTD